MEGNVNKGIKTLDLRIRFNININLPLCNDAKYTSLLTRDIYNLSN